MKKPTMKKTLVKKPLIKKLRFDSLPFSLSTQIAIIFGVLTFIIVVAFSVLVTTVLRSTVLSQKSDDLLQNSIRIAERLSLTENQLTLTMIGEHLVSGDIASRKLLQDSFDLVDRIAHQVQSPYYMSYTVFYVKNGSAVFLGTNDPYLPLLPYTKDSIPVRHIERNFYSDGDLNILYVTISAGTLFLQTSLNMEVDSVDKLLAKLPIIVLILSLPLLFISILTARFLAARMLKPVGVIARTAEEISGSNLDRRIPESSAKDELHALARTFNLLFARLQADFERERQFTSDVSHELRTPLAVLLGHVELLRRWGKDNPEVLNSSLETLHRETKSMQSLVENLLLLSRSERHTQKCEKLVIRVKPLLEKISADMHMVSPEARFEVTCPADATLFTDPDILTQVLRILVTNSINYSAPPAKVSLEYNAEAKTLTVRDRGCGITKEDLPHVFERLYRADKSRNYRTGGSGLGLAIAKTLMHNIGASIRAESAGADCGTSMIIAFPRTDAEL